MRTPFYKKLDTSFDEEKAIHKYVVVVTRWLWVIVLVSVAIFIFYSAMGADQTLFK